MKKFTVKVEHWQKKLIGRTGVAAIIIISLNMQKAATAINEKGTKKGQTPALKSPL